MGDALIRDLRLALRSLARSPGFTAVAIATLALGVATASAVFSIVYGVLLRPLPYPQAERLVLAWEQDADGARSLVGYQTLVDWRQRAKSFAALGAMALWTPTLVEGDGAERLHGRSVSAEFFRVMGQEPMLGRGFRPEEDRPDQNRVAIVSYGLWQRRFGGDPTLVGRAIRLGDTPYLVVGVLPPAFESSLPGPEPAPPEIWRPLGYDATLPWACRDCRHLHALARLAPDATLGSATAELAGIQKQVVAAHPGLYSRAGILLTPFAEDLVGPARPGLLLLAGLVALLLLIAWANLASLFLARAAQRQHELAVQLALGASRWAILRQRLAESLLVAFAGGGAGILLGRACASALIALAPAELPRLGAASPGPSVAVAALGLSLLTAVALALVSGARAWRADALTALDGARGASSSPGRRRAMSALIVADVALSLVLVAGAGLLGKSLLRLLSIDAGFERRGLLTLQVTVTGRRYEQAPAALAFYEGILQGLRALPGVTSAALVSQLPLGGNVDSYGIHAEDKPNPNPALDPSADRYAVTPDYLATLRIPVLRGRSFAASDRADGARVALVSETLARHVWPGEDALGKRVRVGGTEDPWRTVVGVVGDVRHAGLDAPRTPQVYVPLSQWTDREVVAVLRTSTPPFSLAGPARRAIADVDPTQAVSQVATMEEVVAVSTAVRRFTSLLATAFAGLALLLAGVGVAGVVSRSVSDRTREIGIRVALGALPGAIRKLVLSRVAVLTLAGVALGALGARALAPLLGHVLFGVTPDDPATLAAALCAVGGLPLAAGWWPARRAARLDPLRALREE